VRDYADSLGVAPDQAALERGLQEKAAEFNGAGRNLYVNNVPTGANANEGGGE
jgi:hypothetical protein